MAQIEQQVDDDEVFISQSEQQAADATAISELRSDDDGASFVTATSWHASAHPPDHSAPISPTQAGPYGSLSRRLSTGKYEKVMRIGVVGRGPSEDVPLLTSASSDRPKLIVDPEEVPELFEKARKYIACYPSVPPDSPPLERSPMRTSIKKQWLRTADPDLDHDGSVSPSPNNTVTIVDEAKAEKRVEATKIDENKLDEEQRPTSASDNDNSTKWSVVSSTTFDEHTEESIVGRPEPVVIPESDAEPLYASVKCVSEPPTTEDHSDEEKDGNELEPVEAFIIPGRQSGLSNHQEPIITALQNTTTITLPPMQQLSPTDTSRERQRCVLIGVGTLHERTYIPVLYLHRLTISAPVCVERIVAAQLTESHWSFLTKLSKSWRRLKMIR